MSIEDAINRLANAVSASTQNSAVAEIIRQRDAWQKEYEAMERSRDYYSDRMEKFWSELEHERRVSRGLRSALKRMKSKI